MGIEHPAQWSDLQRAGLMRRRWGLDAILNLLLECAGGTNVLTVFLGVLLSDRRPLSSACVPEDRNGA